MLREGFRCTGIHPFNRDIFKKDTALVKNGVGDNDEQEEIPIRTALKTIMPLPVEHSKKRPREGTSEILTSTPSIAQRKQKKKRCSKN